MNKFRSLQGAKIISIDCETCDPELTKKGPGDRRGGFIAGVSVAIDGWSSYFPIAHEGGGNLDKTKVMGWLKSELKSSTPKLFANAAYDLGFLTTAGIVVGGPIFDVQLAEPLLDESRFSYSLEDLAQEYLNAGKKTEEIKTWLKEKYGGHYPLTNIWRAPAHIIEPYAINDAELPLKIFAKQKKKLQAEKLWDLFLMECKLIPMLVAMRQRGVRVDVDAAELLYKSMTKKQAALMKRTGEFAPWNARDIAKLFDKEGIEYPRTEKTKAPSFTKEWLAGMADRHPLAKQVQEIRHLDKLRETFVKGVVLESNVNGRIHCSFNQLRSDDTGTVSGRFSSSKPNLQQIPVRTDDGNMIRKLFLPEEGQLFGATDFSQIEFRLLVATAADRKLDGAVKMRNAYRNNPKTDFHAEVAKMTGIARKDAKTITFAIAYTAGAKRIADELGVTLREADDLLDEYHTKAPFMKRLSRDLVKEADSTGVIRTLLGRVRHFDLYEKRSQHNGKITIDRSKDKDKLDRAAARDKGTVKRAFTYRALNAYIQGSAADVMKQAMVDVWESGVCDELGAPHLTVHDELDTSVPRTKKGKEAFTTMVRLMRDAVKVSVPLRVDSGTGKNWSEAKE